MSTHLAFFVVTDPAGNLTLVESRFGTAASGERSVTGAIRNNTDRSHASVRVDITLLGEDGNVVENTFAITNDLGVGQTWEFEAPVRAEEVVRAIFDGQRGREYHFHAEVVTPESRE